MISHHPPNCQCGRCRPCRPPAPPCPPPCPSPCPPPCPPTCPTPCGSCETKARVLLPKIIGSGREWLRRWCVCLEVEGLPQCAQPPFTLISVCPSGAQPHWECLADSCQRRRLTYRISLCLDCQVRDGSGCLHWGTAWVSLEAELSLNCRAEECWRHQLMVLPCLRMICPAPSADTPCFEPAREPFGCGSCAKPQCPDLPLYPPPCRWETDSPCR